SRVNCPDITDDEIASLTTQLHFVSESLIGNNTVYIIACNLPFTVLGYGIFVIIKPPLYLITVL
ncbi:hypothetical protein M9458_031114, partial [Cirrhinus mrigala]